MQYSSTTVEATVDVVDAVVKVSDAVAPSVSVADSFYRYEHVRELPPEGVELRRAIRLTVERAEDGYIVSDDFSDVYGEGESYEEAVADYRHALAALKRVLADREARLSPDLAKRLFLLRGVLTDEDGDAAA